MKALEKKSSQDHFWTLPREEQTPILKKIAQLDDILKERDALLSLQEDLVTAYELYQESEDPEFMEEMRLNCQRLDTQLTHLEILNLFSGDHDEGDAIVTIHPGAGGRESADWALMLYEMYGRWCNRNKYKMELMDLLPGEEAGIKSVTFGISGKYAYGHLKTEIGVHRLVRISPFDANKRRHTSFASVFVYADIEEEIEIEVKADDIKVDTYRASGAGGQHVNTTDSAVRITHFPTGIVVQCQNERSQHKNRAIAMKILKARLYEYEQKVLNQEKDKLNSMKQDIAWGSQIRSYVLHPYQMVKDHRTNFEMGNSNAVLNGQIEEFIKAALSQKAYVRV